MTPRSPLDALRSAWCASIELAGQAAGVGIDLVQVDQLRELIDKGGSSFVDAAWTTREQRDANGQPEGLAGKWAAKEAVMKALQRGIGDMDPCEVEIVTTPRGAPQVELHGSARAIARSRRITNWHVSLTHEGGWAAAIAVAASQHVELADSAAITNKESSLG